MPTVEFSSAEINAADEAWGEGGVRQLRMVQFEDRVYVDKRDMNWIIGECKRVQWRLIWQNFWAQVALSGLLNDFAGIGVALIQSRAVITRLTFMDFWCQVAMTAVLQTMGPTEFARLHITVEV